MAGGGAAADRYPPIGDYAVIGDCHTAALISRDGSIDWYCPAQFDSPAVFCRLLDADKGGYLRLAPAGRFSVSRRYRGPTNVLESTFTCDEGAVRVTDLMPVHRRTQSRRGHDVGSSHRLLRLVEGLRGDVALDLHFKPTFEYARTDVELRPVTNGVVVHRDGEYLTLACEGVSLAPDNAGLLHGRMRVTQGERRWLTITYSRDPDHAQESLAPVQLDQQLARTLDYWQRWAATCTYQGPYKDEVLRSALTLKLLTFEPTGAVVAAPTTSLPEEIGGVRNWDYRFTWLRDASLILYALLTLGYREEAEDFFAWLDGACGTDRTATPQVMYTIEGGRELPEVTLDHLEGYRGSRPVRVGNAAAGQRQQDIYGEVLVAAYLYYRCCGEGGGPGERPAPQTWALLRRLVDQAAEQWPLPGHGIWEIRGDPQQYLYSKLMCWAALDRGLRLAQEHGLEAPLDRWQATCEEIRRTILERGYDAERGVFTQAFGSADLDAGALAMPLIGFLPPTDPRVRSTVEHIQQGLTHDGMVYRYRNEDGLPGGEGTFALCTFWLVDALALAGRLEEAHDLFERVVGYANDVGLLSEEIDARDHILLGNFPQGFSHLALIQSAVNLAKAAKHGPETEPETEAERATRAGPAAAEGHSARPAQRGQHRQHTAQE